MWNPNPLTVFVAEFRKNDVMKWQKQLSSEFKMENIKNVTKTTLFHCIQLKKKATTLIPDTNNRRFGAFVLCLMAWSEKLQGDTINLTVTIYLDNEIISV